ncbi:MAG: hypothetical protein GY760_25250, partial [Deltaproteobacteria bacterium]|nr:hypothetical protein [Deltaproteobacteria bacterium]
MGMSKINRVGGTPPKILTSPQGKGKKEQREVIEYYNIPNNFDKPFKKYRVYANKEVKKTLIKLCNSKCAYCESKFLHVYVGDVEHFRPKGKVSNREASKPGYYWLASSWNNLLLSCRNCNQSSRQLIDGFDAEVSVGKHDQFPLIETADTSDPLFFSSFDLVHDEKHRLLINPTKEDPEEFFEYDKNGVI